MEEARTRIVCTIGPASSSPLLLARMMRAGMDVARLNFSHGTHDEHAALFRAVHAAARKAGKTVAILQDLQGPKIRVGELPKKGIVLREGQTVTLTTKPVAYDAKLQHIPLTYHTLHKEVKKDHRIFLDDGNIELSVLRVHDRNIHCSVDVGGVLTSHKGVNVPDSVVTASALTQKDREDLAYGVALGVDWVCVSFVTSPEVIKTARTLAREVARKYRRRTPLIMAKVERAAALKNVDAILEEADGIMLGRGDLGVEIPPSEVPLVQKDIAERCRIAGKPCIVATHMLESMKANPRATRAEISDIANAVFDHVDAVMLSAESATGRYPAVAVQAMAQAITAAEHSRYDDVPLTAHATKHLGEAFAHTIALLAEARGLAALLVPADLPEARALMRYRPRIHFGLLVPDHEAARQVVLAWGAEPIVGDLSPASLPMRVKNIAKKQWNLKRGERVALVTGNEKTGLQLQIIVVT
ncbi:pyruvate kinase [bacterium]|nr:pyruvate kinase [bacterium]